MAESEKVLTSQKDRTSVHYFNPNCNSILVIPGDVTAGTEFHFEGTVSKLPKSFVLAFQESRAEQSEIDIRYEVDVEKTQVVIDSKFGKIQRAVEDERHIVFPFLAASSFVIFIKICDGSTQLRINDGETFSYEFQESNPLTRAKYININGDVHIRKFSILKPELESSTYDLLIPGKVQVGDVFTFVGLAPTRNNNIDIQFLDQNHLDGDIWFHFTSRVDSNNQITIIRDCRIDGVWVHEERSACPPLIPGQHLTVDVAVKQNKFVCWVNEKKFCKYKHRKPLDDISALLIDKCGVMNSITFDRASSRLPPQLTIENELDISRADLMRFFPDNPMINKLSRKMIPGRCIHISGVFTKDARRFVFALDKGLREDIVVYECKVFFETKMVVQSYRNLEWGPEEPVEGDFPFTRGSRFHLQLICNEEGGFNVAVDGIPKFRFIPHLDCGIADHVFVSGDCRISLLASL